MQKPASEITISVLQWDVKPGDAKANQQRSRALLEKAAAEGADLVVLPELCNSGYLFASWEEARASAEPAGGSTEQFWQTTARELGVVIAGGVAEVEQETLYNSLVVIGPEGELARYRKVHLFDREKRWFHPGEAFVVVPLLGTQVGCMICYDGWFPEVPRALALMGAEVVIMSGCVRQDPGWQEEAYSSVAALHMAHAHTNSMYVACALRNGSEQGVVFSGQSTIWGPQGRVSDMASTKHDDVITATLPLHKARFKHRTKRVHPLRDRRPSVYQVLTHTKREEHD